MTVPHARRATLVAAASLMAALAACEAGPPPATPKISPGSTAAPREVNVIAKDWQFLPDPVDFIAGETVLLHVVNGGLEIHEIVIGDTTVQDSWEAAEAAVAEHPPGPTPVVSVPSDVAGIRVVVASGQRVDLTWTVPIDAVGDGTANAAAGALLIGCHIPGHWEKGMVARVRIVRAPPAP